MNIAEFSIKRPVFLTCIVVAMIAVGAMSARKMSVEMFPAVTLPIITVTIPYPGAGPAEIETLVSKVVEEEISTVPGLKGVRSINKVGFGIIVAEFSLNTDVKYAEQLVKDRVASSRRKLPEAVKEPIIRRIDTSDQPVMVISLNASLEAGKLYELAEKTIKPLLEQVDQVGLVDVVGGRKREIRIELDRGKLKNRELSASIVSSRLNAAGANVPIGNYSSGKKELGFRSVAEFKSLDEIKSIVVNFLGNDVPITIGQVGTVVDSLVDETSRTYINGKQGLLLRVYRQSGANTILVGDALKAKIEKINQNLANTPEKPSLVVMNDGSKIIRANVEDVEESIMIGIGLTILVVFLFLGSGRSTIITGLAIPNSLLGAFILMYWCGFTINVMTLLALTLSVGLLVDDAIVVRENIFRHIELGSGSIKAAIIGTKEVTLAVVATTFAVIAVFAPIGFLQGIVGQFFKEFGLTICFVMLISLFDALTMAPMLSAYFAGAMHRNPRKGIHYYSIGAILRLFNWFQDRLEDLYVSILKITIRIPILVIFLASGIFAGSIYLLNFVPKTFLSAQDFGEFSVALDLPPGASLEAMDTVAKQVEEVIRHNPEVELCLRTVGTTNGEPNVTDFFIQLVPRDRRNMNTSEFKELIRSQLKSFAFANPVIKDIDLIAGGQRPFNVNIVGRDLKQLEEFSRKAYARLKDHPALRDVDISYRTGKPEIQIQPDREQAERLGVSTKVLGMELRTLVEGVVPAVMRENGEEYDIRVRLKPGQRDLKENFENTYVPNINNSLIKLSNVANLKETVGPSTIYRQDRARYIQISADLASDGPGMSKVIDDIKTLFEGDLKLPPEITYRYVGQAESFTELIENMILAMALAILFIYLVLASLYESFVVPFTIMLVLPLAICGAIFALWLTGTALDLNSMIGCIMLMGIATKNSILIVDYANQKLAEGHTRAEAILLAGKTRMRPVLMTTFASIAGMLPIAIGLNEASAQRTSMGIAVIGGLISSTLLTLVVVPAAFSFIDRFRVASLGLMKRIFMPKENLQREN
jgi:HAE1 family hydrophobic/amphiphilic exporter-1